MSKQQTPTPDLSIRFDEDENYHCIMQGDRDVAYMAYQGEQGKIDGDRIILACNNHDRLVEALGHTLDSLSSFEDIGYMGDEYFEAKKLHKELTELKS